MTADPSTLPTIDRSTPGFVLNPKADAYFKLATERKSDGDMPSAVKALEAAEAAIAEGETDYSVDKRCRLPLYLQQAGRGQEAADKLIALLDLYPPSWGKRLKKDRTGTLFQVHFENCRGIVYDKLRLVFQRDKRFAEAIPYAVLAETYGLRIERRVYAHLAEKWQGKTAPPDMAAILKAGGTKDYNAAHSEYSEWLEFSRMSEQYANLHKFPELSFVANLLKKLKRLDLLPALQAYAAELLGDFKKSDATAIADVKKILEHN